MIVTVSLRWRIRCPDCATVIVNAFGSRETFDITTQIGALNAGEMHRVARECTACGWKRDREPAIHLEQVAYLLSPTEWGLL